MGADAEAKRARRRWAHFMSEPVRRRSVERIIGAATTRLAMHDKEVAMRKRVLALGLDPAVVDLSQTPGLTPELVAAFIEQQLGRLRASGYDVVSCLVDLSANAEASTAAALGASRFDCVLIGAGLRAAPHLLLFEKLLNLVHERAPHARICFNTTPADSTEAVRRWV